MFVSVLGMGTMGSALAVRLASEGHTVIVWNRTPGRAREATAAGAREAGSIAEAVGSGEVVLTMLANDDAVAATAAALRPALGAEAVYVDCSTISPGLATELAGSFRRFASMPVMGGPDAVRNGQATYLIGGAADVTDRIEPVLSSLSPIVIRLDRPELALAAKVTGNFLLLTGLVALAEAIAVARAGGLDDDQIRLFADHPLVAPALRNRFEAVLTASADGWFAPAGGEGPRPGDRPRRVGRDLAARRGRGTSRVPTGERSRPRGRRHRRGRPALPPLTARPARLAAGGARSGGRRGQGREAPLDRVHARRRIGPGRRRRRSGS